MAIPDPVIFLQCGIPNHGGKFGTEKSTENARVASCSAETAEADVGHQRCNIPVISWRRIRSVGSRIKMKVDHQMDSLSSNKAELNAHVPLQSAIRVRFVPEWEAAIAYSSVIRNSVVLNRTAYIVYLLCNGHRRWADVVEHFSDAIELSSTSKSALRQDAEAALSRLRDLGLIMLKEP
jgi:hypothetical protein